MVKITQCGDFSQWLVLDHSDRIVAALPWRDHVLVITALGKIYRITFDER